MLLGFEHQKIPRRAQSFELSVPASRTEGERLEKISQPNGPALPLQMKQQSIPTSRILPDVVAASRPLPLSRAVRQFSSFSGWHSLDTATTSGNPGPSLGRSILGR
jgi:hypothetical protein